MSDDITFFQPTGRLDTATSPQLENELIALIERGALRILVDCSYLTYISSAGLKLVVVVAKRMRSVNGNLVFCCINRQVSSVFQVTGFTSFLQISLSVSEGLEKLRAAN
jgi:stage II sporulation protein AA (anti-sigma F factor antagonist)